MDKEFKESLYAYIVNEGKYPNREDIIYHFIERANKSEKWGDKIARNKVRRFLSYLVQEKKIVLFTVPEMGTNKYFYGIPEWFGSNGNPLFSSPNLKLCRSCNTKKPFKAFRERDSEKCGILNSECKECEVARASKSYKKNKDSESFKETNRIRVRQYRKNNIEKIKNKNKVKRQSETYKKYVQEYYKKNRPKILLQHKEVCRKAVIELRDWVVVSNLVGDTPEIRPIIKNDKELIEFKRQFILLLRSMGVKRLKQKK